MFPAEEHPRVIFGLIPIGTPVREAALSTPYFVLRKFCLGLRATLLERPLREVSCHLNKIGGSTVFCSPSSGYRKSLIVQTTMLAYQ
jgi:hypothetical protein